MEIQFQLLFTGYSIRSLIQKLLLEFHPGRMLFFFFVANHLTSRVLHKKKRERDQRILLCLRRRSSSLAFLSTFINNEIASVLTASRPQVCRNKVLGKSISFDTPYTLESRLWVKNKIPFPAARRSDADYQS